MTPKKILRRPQPSDVTGWGQNLPPILRRLYAARGVQSDDQLQYTLKHLASPMQLRGIDRAVELLAVLRLVRDDAMRTLAALQSHNRVEEWWDSSHRERLVLSWDWRKRP